MPMRGLEPPVFCTIQFERAPTRANHSGNGVMYSDRLEFGKGKKFNAVRPLPRLGSVGSALREGQVQSNLKVSTPTIAAFS